jgi:hypothetical protein
MKELSLIDLEEKDVPQLRKVAGTVGLAENEVDESNKHDLIYKILEAQARNRGSCSRKASWNAWRRPWLPAGPGSYLPAR